MTIFGRVLRASALAGAFLLAGCGGGTGSSTEAGQLNQQTQGVAVGEPSPNASKFDTSAFAAAARGGVCADLRNRLFVIDQKYVFADRAGNCADAAYSQTLYGATPDKVLCTAYDSIAGPRQDCADESARPLFDTIVKNLAQADLGLGSGHTVEEVKFLVSATAPLAFTSLEMTKQSQVQAARNVVVRDQAAWEALWREHGSSAARPDVNFDKSMVLAVFLGLRPDGCHGTEITSVGQGANGIEVVHTNTMPGPAVMCPAVMVTPAHLVLVERSDAPVSFIALFSVLK
jgi:hypothetical protein